MVIESVLSKIRQAWPHISFTDGDCHTLAIALHQAHGGQGVLHACLRKTIEDDGAIFTTWYSHMVYTDKDGNSWDIDGADADSRWEEQWPDLDVPDKSTTPTKPNGYSSGL